MHPQRKARLKIVILIVLASSLAIGLIVYALRENINLFYPPAEIAAGKAPIGKKIRVGGMVVKDSVQREPDGLTVVFAVTDYEAEVTIRYTGILPDLFAEESGIVAAGFLLPDGSVEASEVLAKHDENYMPPEVQATLKTPVQ